MLRRTAPPLLLLLAATPALAQAPPVRTPAAAAEAAATITASDLRARIGVIAHDSMRGRATPSPGLDATAAWVASEMERLGLVPAGDDGGYVQRYAIETVAVDVSGAGPGLVGGRDLLPSLPPYLPAALSGEAEVVVAQGTVDAGAGLARARVAGKVVVVAGPAGADASRDRATLAVVQALLPREPLAILLASDADDGRWEAATGRGRRAAGPGSEAPTACPCSTCATDRSSRPWAPSWTPRRCGPRAARP